ncbi:recombinase family protein [Streptosporangium sp. NPDC051023]|uniref:recombinase family protein n=1 Tax=Streptosporangium sp. NPDC051023 TaxID=3155410 RepID=UPI0034505C20
MTTTMLPLTEKFLLTGREYLRVSKDRSGRMKSITQQHDDNARSANQHGITLLEPYTEHEAVSASRYARKARDEFAILMADLETGRFGADVLVLWESSRGSRRVGEWATMLDLLEDGEKLVHVTSHGRTYDPANPRDRRSLIDDANDSEYESAKTALRIRRDMAARAAEGRPHGVCPYGLRPLHDARTGRLITWEADPDKAPVIVELFERIRKGHSFKALERDFAARGIVNRRGKPFSGPHLREMATKAVYAGYRLYKGELIEGTWEPIVDRALYWDVQRILSEPAHKTRAQRPGRVRYEYTMIVRCDVCGGPVGIRLHRGRGEYMCQDKGCVRITKADVDQIIEGAILGYLSRPDVYEELVSRNDSVEVATVTAELAKLRAELQKAENESPMTVAEARMFARLIEDLTPKVADAETRLRELTTPGDLVALIEPGADVAKHWKAAPVSARRKVAAILLTPEHLGEVRIARSPVRYRWTPAAERLVWRRAE